MRIADLGAGTGIFTVPFAEAAASTGKVYAIDVDAGLLAIVAEKAKTAGVTNIETIVAGANDPNLPEPVDLLFICDTMHHLPNQAELREAVPQAATSRWAGRRHRFRRREVAGRPRGVHNHAIASG